jgi:hypothetical protein
MFPEVQMCPLKLARCAELRAVSVVFPNRNIRHNVASGFDTSHTLIIIQTQIR